MSRVVIVHPEYGIYQCCEAGHAFFRLPENFEVDQRAAVFSTRTFAERFVRTWGVFPNASTFTFVPVKCDGPTASFADLSEAGVISPELSALAERRELQPTVH